MATPQLVGNVDFPQGTTLGPIFFGQFNHISPYTGAAFLIPVTEIELT